ncbi:MAG: fumarylacetoacetate hydrolase family protein [Spongiibacter sp.]|uniref:Fumarylacetoacetate hydrolase family protein n=1 Tax=Spongiibacter thalassae TaxID=2721624 RepID=A0ABX1GDL1_9GAMM|nr:fumarylacetoacetate hydrolase family protein [Spongiibacter sp.]NKI16482.1 fumarylacetoacetate hydrolase family protein [Spongiibacter thalassae]
MRLVTFIDSDGRPRAGAFIDNDQAVVDLQGASLAVSQKEHMAFTSVLALLEAGDDALNQAKALVAKAPSAAVLQRSNVKLLAPIQPPPQIRDCSCFELHLQQCYESARRAKASRAADPEAALRDMDTSEDDRVLETFNRQPIYYKANRFAVIGPDEPVIWPSYSRLMDFELELACYIGKGGKNISRDQARAHIAGFTIFNDMSARDAQGREMPGKLGPAKGKDFDTGNVMGPCLVTADEIEDPYNLTMVARVNGEEWGRGSTADMRWQFEDLIEHISRDETLYTGEVLGSGTVGNGCGLEHLRYLKPNDVVELEIEQIGILASQIIKAE